jgi:hypothetical protein
MTKTFGPDFLTYLLENEPWTYTTKFNEYQRNYRWNVSVSNLRWYLPIDVNPSPTPSVYTDRIIMSVYIGRITNRI